MTEFVLVMPMLMLVLALLFYFGSLGVRVQQGSAMARYEVWRAAMEGTGPAVEADGAADQLRAAFFPGQQSTVQQTLSEDVFPVAPYRQLLDSAESESGDAARLAWAWLHEGAGSYRQRRGVGERYEVRHDQAAQQWGRIGSVAGEGENPERFPIRRGQGRISGDWAYVEDWRAASPDWLSDLEGSPAAVDATRDAFLESLDLLMEAEARSQAWRTGRTPEQTLSGLMRSFYLKTPRYLGPTVNESPTF
ncbi:MAG: hypothetical protein WD294_12905 [Phycisphaeraceae bacterium]